MARRAAAYGTLGLPLYASKVEVRHAFKRLARQHHPDRPTGNRAEWERIVRAHDALTVAGAVDEEEESELAMQAAVEKRRYRGIGVIRW